MRKFKMTLEEFIEKARKAHGNKYDYTKAIVNGVDKKVMIICPIHGEFEMTPYHHLNRKQGCPKCSGKNRTVEDIINIFVSKYGDKYGYEKFTEYINCQQIIEIYCRKHDVWFKQSINTHYRYSSCKGCRKDKNKEKLQNVTEEYIERCSIKHKFKYDYKNTIYNGWEKDVEIICHEIDPITGKEHGAFKQKAGAHEMGAGCLKCAKQYKYTTEEFIEKVDIIYEEKIDCTKTEYIKANKKALFICHEIDPITGKEHGEFWQTPNAIMSGHGCPKCGWLRSSQKQLFDQNYVIKNFKDIHGETYGYDKFVYLGINEPSLIFCKIHGYFKQTPSKHIMGRGCPECGRINNYGESRLYLKITEGFPNHQIIKNYRNKELFERQEMDIYFPEYKIGVEYQGRQHFAINENWHRDEDDFKKQKGRDERKLNNCKKNGIKLFYFTYDLRDIPETYFDKIYTSEQELIDEINNIIKQKGE